MEQPGSLQSLLLLRKTFDSGITRPYRFRLEQLKKLKNAILHHEQDIYKALFADLKRSPEETWVTEIGIVLSELNTAIRNLRQWMRPAQVATNLVNLPSSSRVIMEPLGVVLIIAPWNYPLQLTINPLIGALAAGNCVVLKPSEFAPATDAIMKKIISESFSDDYVLYVEGEGAKIIPPMMNDFRFDHVFYTGSTAVGTTIYRMAAEKLVPVTLELGGKSPCVIEKDGNVQVAARRIAVSKFSNAGQMCVAPDYVLVHESRKAAFIEAMKETIRKFYGEHPEENYNFGKIINTKQFDRLKNYLGEGEVIAGGRSDRESLFIEPTLLLNPPPESRVMREEIFGPILPILGFTTMQEAKAIIARNPNPLSFYLFTGSKSIEKEWLESVAFGGGCVNNTSWHLTNHHLPFGGIGVSGTGNYHGRYSFETFSHRKAVMKTPLWFDPSVKYPPFKGRLRLFRWLIR